MRPRWRKVLHDLSDNWLRTALVVVSIAVGVFAVGVITGTYIIISQDMSASYAANNPMNVELRTSDFSQEMLDAVENVRGVRSAEGRRVFSARVRPSGESGWTALDIVAIEDFDQIGIYLLRARDAARMSMNRSIRKPLASAGQSKTKSPIRASAMVQASDSGQAARTPQPCRPLRRRDGCLRRSVAGARPAVSLLAPASAKCRR